MAKILIAEDYADIRRVLGLLLAPYGHDIVEADNGKQAVDLAREQHPDLILMDMSMPVLSGWDATRQLKANPETADIPIIALTAHAMRGDRERAWEAGCDGFITKPIDDELLEHTIQQILSEKQEQEGQPEREAQREVAAADVTVNETARKTQSKSFKIHNEHILIVDSDLETAAVIEKTLRANGYRTSIADGADQALVILETEPPDLILCSAASEGLDGFRLAKRIKGESNSPFTPIILVSEGEIEWEKGLDAGADDFIRKPINATEMLVRVQSLIRLKLAIAAEANRADELASVISQMATGVIIVDIDGTVSIVNGRGLEILGKSLDQVIGVSIDDLVSKLDLSYPDCTRLALSDFPLKRAFSNGETIEKQIICITTRGRRTHIRVNAGPIYNEHSRKIGAVCVFEEVGGELQLAA